MGEPTPRSPRPNNFYGILGIPRTASLSDIGKAYKSLVMRWHPDKNASNKEEAEAKFKEINEAYTVLSSKKREENEPTTPGSSFHRQSVDFESFFSNQPSFPQKTFSNQPLFSQRNFSNPPSFSRSTSRRSTTPTPSPRPLSRNSSRRSTTPTPADFYASLSRSTSGISTPKSPTTPTELQATPKTPSKTMTFEQPFLSKVTSRRNTTPIIFSQSTARRKPHPIEKKLECTLEELCHGCVKKIKITRDAISDNGMIIQEEEILKIKVKPGWKKGTKITFEGKGDERPGTLPADIIFSIDEKRHPLFKRDGDDLEIGVEVPLIKALTGCTITVPLLGGDKMTLSFDDIIYPGYEKAIRGQGMPISREQGRRGDLRLKFLVGFPTDLSDEQISDVLSILKDCS